MSMPRSIGSIGIMINNRLLWEDVNLEGRFVILYTRKKKGGHLTPRKVPRTQKLCEVLSQRHEKRDKAKPWIFWHRYWSRKRGRFVEGTFGDRKKVMKRIGFLNAIV